MKAGGAGPASDRATDSAARANEAAFAHLRAAGGAPHLTHAALRQLYQRLAVRLFSAAAERGRTPSVLDLGAGEGAVTLTFLGLGAQVTAVDLSDRQIEALRERCRDFGPRLSAVCAEASEALENLPGRYDIIAATSVLHHVPDYVGLVRRAALRLEAGGQFFSFGDPLRYDSLSNGSRAFSALAYLGWRIFQGDLVGGALRRLRRSRGIYLDDSVHDNSEYHVTRNGVDQDALRDLLENLDFECEIVRYFSTQSRGFQRLGEVLGIDNSFALVARKRG